MSELLILTKRHIIDKTFPSAWTVQKEHVVCNFKQNDC